MVSRSRANAKCVEYRYQHVGYASESKQHDITFANLVKGTVKDLVSSHKLKKIYLHFLPSINRLISKMGNHVDCHSELKQLALVGIWSALCKHHNDKDMTPGYIYNYIKSAITQGYIEDATNYSMKSSRTTYRKYCNAIKSYRDKYNHEPTNKELADYMGIKLVYVQKHFFQQSYSPVSIEDAESVLSVHLNRRGAWYWQRKNDYENSLIYWIDRRWANGVLSQLGPQSTAVMTVKALGINITKWQKKNGLSNAYFYPQYYKTLEYVRLLEKYKYRPTDGCPRQYLISKGYQVGKIWRMALKKKR